MTKQFTAAGPNASSAPKMQDQAEGFAVDGEQPVGSYRIETDEDRIEGLSFNAFHRVSTMLFLPAYRKEGTTRQSVRVDPQELAEALVADGKAVNAKR